jgi:hypothetical protein
VRLPGLVLLLAVASSASGSPAGAPAWERARPRDETVGTLRGEERARPPRVAGIGDTVPGLFLSLVNDAIKGKISPRAIRYDPPSSVILEDAVLADPAGAPVARVARARATLSLRALLSREIVISRIDLVEPRLLLELTDEKLNLLEALTPKKPPDKSKPPKAAFRIDAITAVRAGFRFTDQQNVTVTGDDITASASLEIDLARDVVIVDVRNVSAARAAVKLPELDVPLSKIQVAQVRVLRDRLDVMNAQAVAAGAAVTAAGRISLPAPGGLNLRGTFSAPANAWPERLERLPFDTPAVRGSVEVTGAYEDPRVLVDATLQGGKAYGYAYDGGRGILEVQKARVRLLEGTQLKAGAGVVRVEGSIALPENDLDLRLRASDIALARALTPAKLEPAPKGVLHARATLKGKADGKSPLRLEGSFGGRRVELAGVKPRGDLEGAARLIIEPKRIALQDVTLDGDRLRARASGEVFVADERVALRVSATADDATAMVDGVPPEIRLDGASFEGTVNGPYRAVRVEGRARATRGRAYGVPLEDVDARVSASAQQVIVKGTTATAAGGAVRQLEDLVIQLKDGAPRGARPADQKSIRGKLAIEGLDLARVQAADPANADLQLAGRANAEAVLLGRYDDPVVDVRAAAGGLVVAGERLDQATATLRVTKSMLTIHEVKVTGALLDARSEDVSLTLPELQIGAQVHIERVDLAAIQAAKEAELSGTARGTVTVRGAARAPDLVVRLQARDAVAGPQRFGDGPIELSLIPDVVTAPPPPPAPAAPKGGRATRGAAKGSGASGARPPPPQPPAPRDHVARIAALLRSDMGVWDVTSSFAIQRKVLNAKARITDVDLAPFTRRLGDSVAPLEGYASGSIDAWGPLESLTMRARLRVPEVAVAPARMREADDTSSAASRAPVLRPLGSLLVEASMDRGNLVGRVCAFPRGAPQADAPCSRGERVWANVLGSVDVQEGTFDVAVSGQLEERALEDLFPALSTRGFLVGAKARADAQIVKEKQKPLDIRAQATLLEASVQPPGSLRAHLMSPAELLIVDRRLKLESPARFAAPSGEVDVVVAGEVGEEEIALDLNGAAALSLAKLFTQQIANASGNARMKLSLRGRYDTGVLIEGNVTPSPGSVITPRGLGQPVTFQSGLVSFAPLDNQLMRVTAVGLLARVGEGDAQLRGSVDVRTAREPDQVWVARWDLSAAGNGLTFKLPTGRGEGSLELTLTGTEQAPLLRGRVEVTDGLYRKNFELRNFVLSAPPEKRSEPLWVTLIPIGLENLELDVALSVQNFRARANVANFDADLMLRGNLRVGKTLRLPELGGAIEVEEGTIDFPRARFEVNEMQIEFPTTGDGRIKPLVHMTARAEIPPGGAGANDTEIPIDLYLDGDLEEGITLDLMATDPQREWSRSDLLGLVLFGKSFESTVAEADTSIALRALMREAAAPLTAELEQLAQEALGVAVEIDPSGWRWQLGRRLQLEGAGFLLQSNADATSATGTTTTTSAVDAVRLRLLILDHLPIGKNLSLEGRSGPAGGDLRLSLRLFEE